MKITKQRFGYVLETGCAVIVFDWVEMQSGSIPDIELYANGEAGAFLPAAIPNQHIKEFEQKFIEAGGVIE